MSVSDLATGVGISRGWASRVVEELERSGYVDRRRSDDDRRIVYVRLSAASAIEIERLYRWRGDAVDAALAPFDPGERLVIRAFLARLVLELQQTAVLDPHVAP
jgi:MarR family transcriptional repressor of emrRAB